MCTETANYVLQPSVLVARVNRREAKIDGGRPPGVFEVAPNAITSHVPPHPNPGDDVLLELSPNHDHSNGASDRYAENTDTAVPDPEESYHSSRHRKRSRYCCGSIEKPPRMC